MRSVVWKRRRIATETPARRKTLSQSSQYPMEATPALQRFVSLLLNYMESILRSCIELIK